MTHNIHKLRKERIVENVKQKILKQGKDQFLGQLHKQNSITMQLTIEETEPCPNVVDLPKDDNDTQPKRKKKKERLGEKKKK